MLSNVTNYIDILTTDTTGSTTSTLIWTTILNQFDTLFRKIQLTISSFENINLIFKLMIIVLKIPGIISTKVKFNEIQIKPSFLSLFILVRAIYIYINNHINMIYIF